MAVFDPESQKVVVRVVYDGPGQAGKTTNLQQLCNFFTTFRRSELYSPEESSGRTTYFDWLQIDSGLVGGRPLRSHFITVPGQTVLARRRFELLQLADVVVFVCDTSPPGLEDAKAMLDVCKMFLDSRGIGAPLVVQANKQDLPSSLGVTQVRRYFELDDDTPVVAAQAQAGTGVRETAVLAIRAAADRVQSRIREEGLGSLEGESVDGPALHRRIEEAEKREPMSPVDVVLRHANGHHPDAARAPEPAEVSAAEDSPADDPSRSEPADPTTVAPRPSEVATVTPESNESPADPTTIPPQRDESPLDSAPAASPPATPQPHPSKRPTKPIPPAGSLFDPRKTPSDSPDEPPTSSERRIASAPPGPAEDAEELPPLPTPDVASGFVWPSTTGRDVLRRIPRDEAVLRADLQGSYGLDDGSGRTDAFIFEAGVWCLKTAARRHFDDVDKARASLLRLARLKIQLGDLLVRDTVLSIERSEDGTFWLWTIAPWLTTFRSAMSHAHRRCDDEMLGQFLARYAQIAIYSAGLVSRRGIILDVHPSNFAILGDAVHYVDDDIAVGSQSPALGYSILQRVDEYADRPEAVESYLAALETGFYDELSPNEVEDLDLYRLIDEAVVRTSDAQEAKIRLATALRRRPSSVS